VDEREAREARESAFWDEHVPSLAEVLEELEVEPDPNTQAMIDAVQPVAGAKVLDFAAGAGVLSARLARQGAKVTALDVSPRSTERTLELAERTGLSVTAVTGELGAVTLADAPFDRIVGRWALHHVDCRVVGPQLAELLRPGGRAAFLETMGTNPLLSMARAHLAGRAGVAKYGTDDERPLSRGDLRVLRSAFGALELQVRQLRFLDIFDRNVLRYRWPRVSRAVMAVDQRLLDRLRRPHLSYEQVVILRRPA
jgi:protein-L-isoaspartate O-methyltransferase